jgi:glycosyltransferase involved in cell wall biosynthesis
MKVAVVLNTSWNIYNFRKGLIRSLMDKGNQVITIAPKDTYTYKLMDLGCRHIPVKMDSRGANPIKDFLLVLELYWIYKKIKPDVILHYTIKPNIYGTIAASFLGIPVINNVCGLGTMFLKDNLVSRVAILMYRIAFRFPKKIFFQNNDDRKLFIKRKIVSKKVCDLLPGSGINTGDFTPGRSLPSNKPFTFLLISRLIYDKGILEYIEAIDQLKKEGIDAKFQLLGQIDEKHKRGIPEKTIQGWIEKNQVEYLGSTEDVRTYIENSDCVVLPSYREGTPKTLLEAASMSKPIVATNVPGCNNVVLDGKNGFLCKMKDSKDLALKMRNMLSLEAGQRTKMGTESREYVIRNFDESIVIRKYLDTIEKIK